MKTSNLIQPATPSPIFGKISEISPEDPATYEGRIFLTLDVDWAADFVIEDTLDLLEKSGASATWFATHSTPVLGRILKNPLFEVGLHPNFNPLLQGSNTPDNSYNDVLAKVKMIAPNAISIRSHSMTQSSILLDAFAKAGFAFDCNHFIPAHSGIALKPWRHWNNLVRVPYFWEDDVACLYKIEPKLEALLSHSGLRVFDFHPIHVFLNTREIDHYENTRTLHHDPTGLLANRKEGVGTRSFFRSLISMIATNGKLT